MLNEDLVDQVARAIVNTQEGHDWWSHITGPHCGRDGEDDIDPDTGEVRP